VSAAVFADGVALLFFVDFFRLFLWVCVGVFVGWAALCTPCDKALSLDCTEEDRDPKPETHDEWTDGVPSDMSQDAVELEAEGLEEDPFVGTLGWTSRAMLASCAVVELNCSWAEVQSVSPRLPVLLVSPSERRKRVLSLSRLDNSTCQKTSNKH